MAYTTNKSLLMAIKQGNGVSWQRFYDTYRPLIVFCGMQKLNENEIDDLVQNVMLKFFNAQKTFNYDPAKGFFRHYLGKIIHNEIINILRSRKQENDDCITMDFPDEVFDKIWQEQWKIHLLTQSLEELKKRVSETTYQAFDLYAMQDMPPAEVAEFLNLKITQVYKAKIRCTAILRDITGELHDVE